MRLTVYTDYTLRVLMYLALRYPSGELATIEQIATAYGISRNHLTKIVHQMGLHGLIATVRGRAGGMRLARPPAEISVGGWCGWPRKTSTWCCATPRAPKAAARSFRSAT
jgi:Rrf2 family nitric oxide-sensitive transcriptional repressor